MENITIETLSKEELFELRRNYKKKLIFEYDIKLGNYKDIDNKVQEITNEINKRCKDEMRRM